MNLEDTGLIDKPPAPEEVRRQMRVQIRGYMILVALVSLLVGGLIGYFTRPEDEQQAEGQLEPPAGWGLACEPVTPEGTPHPTPTPGPLHIYVSGAVVREQVVTVTAGSLVAEALAAAGGPTAAADLNDINLAAPLADHQHIIIPTQATPAHVAATAAPTTAPLEGTGKINLNTATSEELQALSGIGQTRAQDIVAYRTANGDFQQIEDIQDVSGIGPVIFARIAPYITVGDE
ncbi:MAG: helix-hairpin-helix domain-containing protein [Chloroflexota bacterium]|nr:helix-hairpin-helix domain-containing protein [Chloroflexota bacterium]